MSMSEPVVLPDVSIRGPATDGQPQEVETRNEHEPTASHKLADVSHDDAKTIAKLKLRDVECEDLGWNQDANDVPRRLIGDLSNEELWTLIRRFDKQIFHVKAVSDVPLANLDLNIADVEEFTPEKLRASLERFYTTIGIGLFSVWKQIVRLRSWREGGRTSAFLAVYTAAWIFDCIIPSLIAFLTVLIVVPASRAVCFPPAPPALIDSETGGVQKPAAGTLASDSITGAPEKHQGEAIEQEAHSFVNSIVELAGGMAAAKHPQDIANVKDKTGGNLQAVEDDKTKNPVSDAVWRRARPVMHATNSLVDTYERFGNALSATPPFPKHRPRLILATCLLGLFLGSCYATAYMAYKGTGFAVGLVIFGDPLIQRSVEFTSRYFPRWKKYTSLRNTVLRGIPTDAQLTLTLLRVGERNGVPLPPPPSSREPPTVEGHLPASQDLDQLGATREEIDHAIRPTEETKSEAEGGHNDSKPKKSDRLLAALKGAAKGGASAALGGDRIRALVGSKDAKNRLGVVKTGKTGPTGPTNFPARFEGKKGHVYMTATTTTPTLSWTTSTENVDPAWTIKVADIHELQKTDGLGWKSKILVSWATDKEIADGIIMRDKQGHEYRVTAIALRDPLFNRLIALSEQKWESW